MSKFFSSLALVAFTAAVTPQALKAEDGQCPLQNATMNGTYVFSLSGTLVGTGPTSSVGLVTYDGQGSGVLGPQTRSVNGMIMQGLTATATFTVNRDCTGSKTVGSGASAAHFDFVITPDGSTITFIRTDIGFVVSGTAVRLRK